MAKTGYGQFCPVAKTAEVLAERWMPLVVRELLAGSCHFGDLRRGIPLISPATLSQRLQELVDARIFASGSPSGQLLVTTAVYDDPVAGATVLHLPVPLDGPGVHIHDNWRTMGMRATGSNDITIEGVFVPDHSVGVRRPKGKWHEFFDVHSAVVWPLVMSVYVGVAEAARPLALSQAAKRRDDPIVQGLVGEMDTHLAGAQVALREMVALGSDYDYQPSLERSSKVFVYKTIVARSALCAVERALEVCGGASFFRSAGIERILRDIQGVRFHPWQERKQYVFSGRVALGLEPV